MSYGRTDVVEKASPLHFGTLEWYHQCTALDTVREDFERTASCLVELILQYPQYMFGRLL